MRPRHSASALLLSLLLGFGAALASSPPTALTASYAPIAPDGPAEGALLQHSNLERRGAGLTELRPDEALALAARHHAEEMVRLRYLAHESPTPENATLSLRVARAGSAAQFVGENLARLPSAADAPRQAIRGWMESPGHRANLLHPAFTHAGFGVASTSRGEVYVVQVLAALPLELAGAEVRPLTLEEGVVELSFELRVAGDVLFLYGEEQLPAETLPAGAHKLSLPLSGQEPLHIQAGLRAPSGEGGFIGQDGGWFIPAESSWQPSSAAGADLSIRSAEPQTRTKQVYRVTLRFARPPAGTIGVWLDEVYLPDATLNGDELVIDLPRTSDQPAISLGVPTSLDSARFEVVLALSIKSIDGAPQLYPHNQP
ncbi:MAG: CAP domain-containing protein [Deinococcota bacterium]|nr:CAP domain-containing protein [Deinococcota bacterium]